MKRLTTTLREQQAEAACLCRGYGRQVAANLSACRAFGEGRKELGYGE
jgi:hypothetical protein